MNKIEINFLLQAISNLPNFKNYSNSLFWFLVSNKSKHLIMQSVSTEYVNVWLILLYLTYQNLPVRPGRQNVRKCFQDK
jgi:hypothetical protein